MKGLFIPGITENMFRNASLESIEALMAEGEIYGLDYSDWTLASERLPEQAGEYLVTYHPCCWGQVRKGSYVGLDTFRGKTTWAKNKYQKVIAWKPLPKPYKAGEE